MKRVVYSLALFSLCAVAAFAAPKTLKMRIAVAPLDWSEHNSIQSWQIPVEFQNAIYEKLVKKLFDTGKFIVLERDAMQALLTEKSIKEDNTGQGQKGKIVPAQTLVKAKLTDFDLNSKGGGGGIGIGTSLGRIGVGAKVSEAKVGMNVRMFDVDTSEMIASESASKSVQSHSFAISGNINSVFGTFDAYERSPLGEATTKALDEAVEKILKKMEGRPWTASVADWDAGPKEVTINAGSEVGVQVGDVFDVYKVTKVIKDPETGQVLGKKTSKSGSIKITSVDKKFAVGVATDGTEFNVGDIVKDI